MKRNSLLVILISVLSILVLVPTCIAETAMSDIAEFDAAQYVTGEAEVVDIYASLSFGMFPEQAIVEAKNAGVYIERNPYVSTFDVYTPNQVLIEEYFDAELHYYFDTKGEQLLQLFCVFNDPSERIYNAIEKILTEKYGETTFTSDNGTSIGEIYVPAVGSIACSTVDAKPYSQRVIKQNDGKYIIVEHKVENTALGSYIWPFHKLVITIVNP